MLMSLLKNLKVESQAVLPKTFGVHVLHGNNYGINDGSHYTTLPMQMNIWPTCAICAICEDGCMQHQANILLVLVT